MGRCYNGLIPFRTFFRTAGWDVFDLGLCLIINYSFVLAHGPFPQPYYVMAGGGIFSWPRHKSHHRGAALAYVRTKRDEKGKKKKPLATG